jgi:hypothetical protein
MGALDTAIQPSEHDPSSATASAPDAGTGTPESESPPRRRRTTRVAERLPDTAPRDAAVWVWGALPGTAAGGGGGGGAVPALRSTGARVLLLAWALAESGPTTAGGSTDGTRGEQ